MRRTYAVAAVCSLAVAVLASRLCQGAPTIPHLHGGLASGAIMTFALAAVIDLRP